jgi:hypothetical protein
MPKKWGPLSLDMIVGLKIYRLERHKKRVGFSMLVSELDGYISKSTLPGLLNELSEWNFIEIEYGETVSGRAGRFYTITGEANLLFEELNRRYGERIFS